MKKITTGDEQKIVRILRNWPAGARLTWEALRTAIMANSHREMGAVWTRQALSDNESIRSAYKKAKRPAPPSTNTNRADAALAKRISELETELEEVTKRFDLLKMRHTQLMYNASLLQGGTHLLDDPLPDNTRSRQG